MATGKIYAIGEKIEYTQETEQVFEQDLQLWSDATSMQLSAEPYNGFASIIWNGYLKNLFREGVITPTDAGRELFRWDRNVSHRITLDGAATEPSQIWVTRGRALPKRGYGAMYEIEPKYYEGFPLDLVFLMRPSEGIQIITHPHPTMMTLTPSGTTFDTTNKYEVVSIDCSAEGTERVNIIHWNGHANEGYDWARDLNLGETPHHPFYIRWIGRLGGYEHLMLSCKQRHALNLDKITTYERAEDVGIQQTASAEVSHKVSASTGLVSRETLEKISSILYSPYIQYYDVEGARWITIQLTKGQKANWNTDQSIGEQEFTFELPNEVYTN